MNGEEKNAEKIIKIILFLSVFLFVVFISKKIIESPKGNIDFLIKNLISFICAIIITGIILQYLNKKYVRLIIPLMWIATIFFAIY